ncbi:undecaprenyl/decaprenyl-phosphate alpha-N-acetylglucosaminyl 1-phosphate transferase [Nakamurella flavida]|uniref:Undecaprenyl/decaprenyl-phosphate alpha-N-acetylglucosaminyl 1-phosphate transferase n=1 Tax=Nakamurella flavida TaxID=363630 RepID=A0A938YHX7_9ACTN|nr:MraY family glycosyltransferase [Nakamurella flavida]MBM9474941.1 undecaprenyl/decaprenyl-phosphate alpha-N-acetylglucosaminyl 1-phosphate transferase [Nakamurella flavida]MDP9776510.1 UDP-GlcNAc:undecaprenyl-phosphate GlcNAc-1-phosphate transferase [Nakamurella flavida]
MSDYAIPAREYALVFASALIVTFLLTGVVRTLAVKVGAVTPIRDRDVHRTPVPRMGGVAVFAGFSVAVLMAMNLATLGSAFRTSSEIMGVLAAGAVICAVGVLDDRFDLDAVTKLAGQILAAGVMALFGVQVNRVWVPSDEPSGGSLVSLDQTQSTLITILLTVILVNAMNFIDGLDGLLAGVALISGLAVFAFSARQLYLSANDTAASQAPLIAAALVGACLGFLPHNFSPARIFMGDSGAMFIGLAMAGATISATSKLDTSTFGPRTTIAFLAPLIVALAVVFIPILDFLLAVIRRTRKGLHPFSADKEHLHHRMLSIGHTQRQAVLIFYLWAALLAGSAVSLAFVDLSRYLGIYLLVVGGGLVLAVTCSAWPRVRAARLSRRQRQDTRAAESALPTPSIGHPS